MKFDLKNILLGCVIGIISTTSIFLVIGDVNIQTDFRFEDKLSTDNKDIRISIEKNIDEYDKEIIIVNVIGKGSVTMEYIENELEKIFSKQNIDASSGIEVNLKLDNEIDFE
tara:strand:+ start:182 stop:517 length:336 start_codon:yes stop_codon:yes gene_type:complete